MKQRREREIKTYVMRTLMRSAGEEADELSLERIQMTRSSGKVSNKSDPFPVNSGEIFALFRQGIVLRSRSFNEEKCLLV